MLTDTDVELRNALGFETGIWDIESIAWTFPKRAKIKNVWRTEAVTNIRNKLRPVCCIEYPAQICADVILTSCRHHQIGVDAAQSNATRQGMSISQLVQDVAVNSDVFDR